MEAEEGKMQHEKELNQVDQDLRQLDLDDDDIEDFVELEAEVPEENQADANSNSDEIGLTNPSDLCFAAEPVLSPTLRRKKNDLLTLLAAENVDRARLIQLALSEGGLVDDEIRKEAWPLLLDITNYPDKPPTQEEIEAHTEYRQVVMDVNRSLKRFPPGIPYEQRVSLQDQLTRLIMRVIMKYPHLCYYQGYHDVAVTFLLVVGEDKAFYILEKLSTDHLRVCMEPTMDTTSRLLNIIYPLLKRKNNPVYEHLEASEAGTLFALPWFLTWFGHSLGKYSAVVRMYDFFLCSAPLMPLYVATTIVLFRAEEVLETPCRMDSMHALLSQLPDTLPFEKLMVDAENLYLDFPPESVDHEVEERTKKELEMRLNPPVRQIKKKLPPTHGHPFFGGWRHVFAAPRPRSYVQVLMATASVMFSIYMYVRSGTEPGQLPISPS